MIELIEWGPKRTRPGAGRRPNGESAATSERVLQMAEMFKEGKTLQQIGDAYSITRERVRQLLKKAGVEFGGSRLRSYFKKKGQLTNEQKADQLIFNRHGCSFETWKKIGADGRKAFCYQKRSAKYRGIAWELNLGQWFKVWEESGMWELRGRGKGKYCMSRIADCGPYSLKNVRIVSVEENGRESMSNPIRKRKAGGVYHLYPGLELGWVAKYGRKVLGYYKTEQEAREAREKHYPSSKREIFAQHTKEFLELRAKGVKLKDIANQYGVSEIYVGNRIYYRK